MASYENTLHFWEINRMVAISRFSRTLATLLHVKSYGNSTWYGKCCSNLVLEDAIQKAADNIIKGRNFADR